VYIMAEVGARVGRGESMHGAGEPPNHRQQRNPSWGQTRPTASWALTQAPTRIRRATEPTSPAAAAAISSDLAFSGSSLRAVGEWGRRGCPQGARVGNTHAGPGWTNANTHFSDACPALLPPLPSPVAPQCRHRWLLKGWGAVVVPTPAGGHRAPYAPRADAVHGRPNTRGLYATSVPPRSQRRIGAGSPLWSDPTHSIIAHRQKQTVGPLSFVSPFVSAWRGPSLRTRGRWGVSACAVGCAHGLLRGMLGRPRRRDFCFFNSCKWTNEQTNERVMSPSPSVSSYDCGQRPPAS
jgi:hypothetical protein